jgi:oligoendopeptidase F
MKKSLLPLFSLSAAVVIMGLTNPQSGPIIPDYSQAERSSIPEAFRWRFEDIYASPEVWRAELLQTRKSLVKFEAGVKKATSSPARLTECLILHEELSTSLAKLVGYPSLQSQVQWSNALFQNMLSEARRLQVDLDTATRLLETNLRLADESRIKSWVESEQGLGPYRLFLRRVQKSKAHSLPEDAERVAAQVKLFSDGPRTAADVLRGLDMPRPEVTLPDGSKLVLAGANWMRLSRSAKAEERRAAYEAMAINRKRFENTFAALLDMSVKRDLFEANIRGFSDCLSAELFPYDVDPKVYRNLVQTVRSRLEHYHRFLQLKKRILGLEEFHTYDLGLQAAGGPPLRYSFDDARRLVQEAVAPIGPEYASLARRAFDERWFDVFGHKDKINLGSANALYGVHPYICLDFLGRFFDLLTVAHELGHGLNFWLSEKTQPFAAADPVWFASEVPSIMNEILLIKHLLQSPGDDRGKLALLSEFLERLDVLLFFSARQAELQLAAHEHVEKGGTLSPEWLNARQLELERHYYGAPKGIMTVEEYVQSDWNHPNMYFAPFQGYFYVVGAVTSLALADKIREGGETAGEYIKFLKAGSSQPIMDVLRHLGVDLSTPKAVEDALSTYDRLVADMDRLSARMKKNETDSSTATKLIKPPVKKI